MPLQRAGAKAEIGLARLILGALRVERAAPELVERVFRAVLGHEHAAQISGLGTARSAAKDVQFEAPADVRRCEAEAQAPASSPRLRQRATAFNDAPQSTSRFTTRTRPKGSTASCTRWVWPLSASDWKLNRTANGTFVIMNS
jgi:hypothetical protein